jgi:general secretion pathway protein G
VLRQDLLTLRYLISQYALDKHELPRSLDDLVGAGYLRQIPIDPVTGNPDWAVDMIADPIHHEPGISDLHSSSTKESSDGRAYNKW